MFNAVILLCSSYYPFRGSFALRLRAVDEVSFHPNFLTYTLHDLDGFPIHFSGIIVWEVRQMGH